MTPDPSMLVVSQLSASQAGHIHDWYQSATTVSSAPSTTPQVWSMGTGLGETFGASSWSAREQAAGMAPEPKSNISMTPEHGSVTAMLEENQEPVQNSIPKSKPAKADALISH